MQDPGGADACPIMTACIGECGQTIATQALIASASKGLQLSFPEGSLCANEAIKLTLQSGTFTWTQTFGAVAGPIVLPWPLAPPDVLSVTAVKVAEDPNVVCKREGNFLFALTLLH